MALGPSVLSWRFCRPFWNRPFGRFTSPPWKVKPANAVKTLRPPCSQTTTRCILYHHNILNHLHVDTFRWRDVPEVTIIIIISQMQEICMFLSKRSRAVMMEIFIDQAISRVYSCRLNQIHNHMDSFLRCDVLRASGLKSKRPHPSWHLDKIHRGARSTSDRIEDMLLAQARL